MLKLAQSLIKVMCQKLVFQYNKFIQQKTRYINLISILTERKSAMEYTKL